MHKNKFNITSYLGHAGDEGPHFSMTGESRGCSRAAAPVCGFSRLCTTLFCQIFKYCGSQGSGLRPLLPFIPYF